MDQEGKKFCWVALHAFAFECLCLCLLPLPCFVCSSALVGFALSLSLFFSLFLFFFCWATLGRSRCFFAFVAFLLSFVFTSFPLVVFFRSGCQQWFVCCYFCHSGTSHSPLQANASSSTINQTLKHTRTHTHTPRSVCGHGSFSFLTITL